MLRTLRLLFLTLLAGCSTGADEPAAEPVAPLSRAEEINRWIYAQMRHYYLWNDQMPDSAACDFTTTPREFYESLLAAQDRFSYLTSASRSRSAVDRDYGFAYQPVVDPSGRAYWQVLYVTSDAARRAGLRRGDLVVAGPVDGDSVRLCRFTRLSTRTVADSTLTYAVTPQAAKNETVYVDSLYEAGDGRKIGYLCYLEFDDPLDFRETINRFHDAGIRDLILDLRYNPGGRVSTCRKLCSLLASSNAYGQLFQQCSYNDEVSAENRLATGDALTYSYFDIPNEEATAMKPYRYLDLERLFVLVSAHTASASEATVCCLRPYMEVVLIGESTTGKGVGMFTLSDERYPYALVPITFRYYNAHAQTVPETGLEPDYYLPDGYATHKKELGNIEEPLLRQALRLIAPELYPEVGPSQPSLSSVGDPVPVGEPSFVRRFRQKQLAAQPALRAVSH